ncbi:hypothetical protein KC19_5G051800 [Ceratodon purpureus]|uniref:Germin-like protein n=1 Tax=Ceratodon purpureus TaxID=3225 RepID=A0A8T0HZ52_CERPU|nr:hypothetical protein KC19_5G051800 [Ceratodon purpureus]
MGAYSTQRSTHDLFKLLVVALCATAFFLSDVHAVDPDPLADFCVADLSPSAPRVNGYACKPRSNVTTDDFVYRGFRQAIATDDQIRQSPTGAVVSLLSAKDWPGLNTQGITHARLDFAIGGVIPLHTHPRAAETLFVVKGTIYTGFIGDDNVLYASTLQVGDVTIFPKALLHFQLNVGNETAITFNTLNSQAPGLLVTALQLFKPNITSAVIEKSFGVDATTVQLLKGTYPGHP